MAPIFKADADPQITASPRHGFRLPVIVAATVLLATAARLVLAVWRYSVNLIFWDQWDFYTPLFQHASLWRIFNWQHGPHREGIGLVLDKFVLDSTRWNSRAEALFMVATLSAAALVALRLKQKLFGSWGGGDFSYGDLGYSDIAIPCLFLTCAQMEALVGEANPSYSAIPELLIGLYCLAWMLPKPIARYAAVLVLNFLLIYTGFGFFMGVVTIGVLLFDLRRAFRTKSPGFPVVALLLAAASLAGFFYRYRFDPAVPCFHFPDAHPLNYPWFIGLMLSYFLGLRTVLLASVAGSFLALVALAVLIWHGVRLWRNLELAAADLTIVVLLSFSLLFGANAAVGRVCLGMPEAAQLSRYAGLLVPAFLAIYFHLLTWRKSAFRTALLALFALALIPGAVRMPNGYSPQLVSDGKQAWKTCILQIGNINYCDRATGFPLYPDPRRTQLLEKLQFLQKNRLNLYSGDR
ncbi:MAG: hypothetical protein WCA13_15070 [Terriglobales bacterium]